MDSLSLPYVNAARIPCQTCMDRCLGCHSACERYAAFRARLERLKTPRREELITSVGFADAAHRLKLLTERRKRGKAFG